MNLALLRVCAIIFIVYILGMVSNLFFVGGHSSLFATLWNALVISSFEDIVAMAGLFIASGLIGPVGLAVLVIGTILALAIFAFVKKNATVLKIVAVLIIVSGLVGSWTLLTIGGNRSIAGIIASLVININVVAVIAAFFVQPKKDVDENIVESGESFNLGLYRFCAISFIVYGLNATMTSISVSLFVWPFSLFGIVTLLGGITALIKKNVNVLMICSLVLFVRFFVALFQFGSIGGFDFALVVNSVIHSIINVVYVVCVATFFIEPERTRTYFQKVKSLFIKPKKST